jgi:hypothetical protein
MIARIWHLEVSPMTRQILAVLGVGILSAMAPAQPPGVELAPVPRQQSAPQGYQAVYRLFGTGASDHLYTTSPEEMQRVITAGSYKPEGVGFYVMDQQYKDTEPLYRFSTQGGQHFLHTDRRAGEAAGAQLDGTIGYIDTQPHRGEVPLYAWFNPANGDSLYTTNRNGEVAPQAGMQFRGIVGYVAPVQ